jgi:hypothetical protein
MGGRAAPPLKQDDTRGDAGVERCDATGGHGDPDQEVAMTGDVLMQACTLSAEYESRRGGVFDAVVLIRATRVEAIDPEAGLFEMLQRARDVGDSHDGNMRQGAGGGAGHCSGEAGGAALGDYDGGGARGMRGADDRAEVVGIFDAVEHYVQAASGGGVFDRGETLHRSNGDDSLMSRTAGGAVQMIASFKADGDCAFAAQIDDFLDASAAGALGDQNAIERAAGPQSFAYRMNSSQRRH